MRLDKYLKVSRLIKRRPVANEACDAGRVLVNDKPAIASVNSVWNKNSESGGPGCTGDCAQRGGRSIVSLSVKKKEVKEGIPV